MYNGIGLQTPRGSGTNGYIQTNKFFIKSKTGKVAENSRGFEGDQGMAGVTKKANRDILEHDRKRQIELKLVVLEDKLTDQGFTDAEIADKLAQARRTLEAAAASEDMGGPTAFVLGDNKVSDTQTHQIAARKQKQMDNLRDALKLKPEATETNTEEIEDGLIISPKDDDSRHYERKEHSFLDRESGWKKSAEDKHKVEKDKKKSVKESRRNKKKESRKRRHKDDSSDTDSSGSPLKPDKKKKRRSRSSSSEEDDSEVDTSKKEVEKYKKRQKRYDSEEDDSEVDVDKKRKVVKKHSKSRNNKADDSDTSDDAEARSRKEIKKSKQPRRRHDSDDDDSEDDVDKKRKVVKKHSKSRNDDTDDSAASEDAEDRSTKEVKKFQQPRRRHDSDDDSGYPEELPKSRTVRGRQHVKPNKRPDSGDESDFDGRMERKSSQVEQQRNQQVSRRVDRDDFDVEKADNVRSGKSRKSYDSDSDYERSRKSTGAMTEKSRRSGRNDTNDDDTNIGRKPGRVEEGDGGRGRHNKGELPRGRKNEKDEEDHDYRRPREGLLQELGNRKRGTREEEGANEDIERDRHMDYKRAKYDESRSSERRRHETDRHNEEERKSRRHGEDEGERRNRRHGKLEEQQGSKEIERDRQDSRSSERRRYENVKHNDGRSRHRD
ncbi:hypothetical protein ABKV19_019945 [Rosa sericea]